MKIVEIKCELNTTKILHGYSFTLNLIDGSICCFCVKKPDNTLKKIVLEGQEPTTPQKVRNFGLKLCVMSIERGHVTLEVTFYNIQDYTLDARQKRALKEVESLNKKNRRLQHAISSLERENLELRKELERR